MAEFEDSEPGIAFESCTLTVLFVIRFVVNEVARQGGVDDAERPRMQMGGEPVMQPAGQRDWQIEAVEALLKTLI